ncbi:MAG: DUF512 domain-containing protein [Oscillospiraceae bacterium]|jgi:putative radical SAM enzyme (TIGR03279 family)|nr:DUF512 domain-containing protein [Oscillospiraceae bacterium]
MPAKILAVLPNTPAHKRRVAPGDILLQINGHNIGDVLDYRFFAAETRLLLTLQKPNGKIAHVRVKKEEYEDPGLEFDDGLMDAQRHCKNKCIFCFVDQLPKGLRSTLYFKDDDARLGFLFGNYITLTNLTPREVRRICAMRLSPVNVSVHTMHPALRAQMMGNPRAGESLLYLRQFAAAGLQLNMQLVLCPGWNDGDALRDSLQKILALPTVQSVAAVPVGLTKHREGLPALRPFCPKEAQSVINILAQAAARCAKDGTPAATPPDLCASDEFFLLAGQEPPGPEYYGGFHQIENGVGLWTDFKLGFLSALKNKTPAGTAPPPVVLATGTAAAPLLQWAADAAQNVGHAVNATIRAIRNDFFGDTITVAGLLTGADVVAQLRGNTLGKLLLPPAMCNADGLTLDGMTIEEISQALGVPVQMPQTPEALLDAITGGTNA